LAKLKDENSSHRDECKQQQSEVVKYSRCFSRR